MKVALAVPHWGNDPVRDRNYEYVSNTVRSIFPFDAYLTTPEGSWNRGSARNYLVERAADTGAEVVVLCDSDIIPEEEPLRRAIASAWMYGSLHFPYRAFRYLDHESTFRFIDGCRDFDSLVSEMEGPGSYGGVFAIRPEDYWKAGGFPELEGWGFEDIIFAVQARSLLDNDTTWHEGAITHLWHPSEVRIGSESYTRNLSLCQKFERFDRDPEGIQALMRMMGVHRGY